MTREVPTQLPFRVAGARFVRQVGEGATSTAWLVEDGSGTKTVLKVGRDLGQRRLLAQEARRLLFVESAHLTRVLGAGLVPAGAEGGTSAPKSGLPFLALEWVPGEPLDAVALGTSDRATLAAGVALDVARALEALHGAGTAHGDVKPANVLVEFREGAFERATLIDLGLGSHASEAEPRGGSLRYLAPEVLAAGRGSDALSRDLWAFGATLLEVCAPGRPFDEQRTLLEASSVPLGLLRIVRALLSTDPGARPSARWVRARAEALFGFEESPPARVERRRRAVKRAYLGVRRRELERAARRASPELLLEGPPALWVEEALAIQREVETLAGRVEDGGTPCTFEPLGALGKARWLTSLVGASAVPWALADVGSDAELAVRALELCARLEPSAWSLGDLGPAPPEDGSGRRASCERSERSVVEVALELGRGACCDALLEAGERLVFGGGAPEPIGLELGRQLRRRGHHGRALAVLRHYPSEDAAAEAAEVLRRTGDQAAARAALAEAESLPVTASSEWMGRRLATLAHLELRAEKPEKALELLEAANESAATLEVRALAELRLGRAAEAKRTLARATALAASDEERARIAGATGFVLHHADGDDEQALYWFRLAAGHAARAGAVAEEATYLTSVAAVAPQVGEFREAIAAAERSELLFECVGRSSDTARAALARAAVYTALGKADEARDAADDALLRAHAASDRICEAYAHLTLCDLSSPLDPAARDHAERARLLLEHGTRDEQLRVTTRRLSSGSDLDLRPWDHVARDPQIPVDVRLEWWGARARTVTDAAASVVLGELCQLAQERSPVAVRGAVLARGALLARRVGDGDTARRLAVAVADAAREMVRRATPELRPAVLGLEWVQLFESPREQSLASGQVTDIETLVRALGQRERLRPLLDAVLDALILWTGVERGLLLLRAPAGKLVPRAARNLTRHDLKGEQLELSRSLAERALAQGEPVVAVDAAGDLPDVHKSVHALKLRSVLAVPLIAHGDVLGVVYLDDRVRRGAFGPAELAWVRLVAAIAAVAIADARDQLLLRRAARRAERAEARLASELAEREARLDVVERTLAQVQDGRDTRYKYDAIIGRSRALRTMLALVDRVAASEVPVLVTGESGSGKELVARAIHEHGPRRKESFVSESCAAIPESLLEATLFGHTRGAFTGAVRPRAGLFEVADKGTLFLDEVGEMSLGMQSKLLRALQDGEIHPIGAARAKRVDVRVIAATHRDLKELVTLGKFREDLLYRLNVILVQVPALRERAGDIPELVQYFLERYGGKGARRVTQTALAELSRYDWPGNVRQLENEVRRALVLSDGTIGVEHLSAAVLTRSGPEAQGMNVRTRVTALEVEMVTRALARTSGNQTQAAELLGLSRFGLSKMIRRLGIQVETPDATTPVSS